MSLEMHLRGAGVGAPALFELFCLSRCGGQADRQRPLGVEESDEVIEAIKCDGPPQDPPPRRLTSDGIVGVSAP